MKNNQNDLKYYLEVIDEIEKVRTKNNINWMDVLRLAFKSNIAEAKKLMKKINVEDDKISSLFKKLSK
tara:strand:+ start:48 stop:251 length:204 start_codon:yes stop_codon:yes gene_type:complete